VINLSIAPPFKAGFEKKPTPSSSKFEEFYKFKNKIPRILRRG
jgi:hypothetical protein